MEVFEGGNEACTPIQYSKKQERKNIKVFFPSEKLGAVGALDSLRMFGALAVIFLHLGSYRLFEDMGLAYYHRLISGTTGVYLFYVLSGFLITSLALEEVQKKKWFDVKNFLIRRVLRLFPLYYLAILCIYALDVIDYTSVTENGYIYALFYSYNFVPKEDYNGLLGSFHTLATEEHFYLVFALIFGLLFKWPMFPRFLSKVIVFSIFLIALLKLGNLWSLLSEWKETHFLNRWTIFAVQPILIGCLSAFIFKWSVFNGFIHYLSSREWLLRVFYYILLITFLSLYLTYVSHRNILLLSVSFAFLVFLLSLFRETWLSCSLQFKPFSYLGKISYGLYVWQAVINGTGPAARWIDSPYLSTALVFVASAFSYEFYEKPFMKLKNRFR